MWSPEGWLMMWTSCLRDAAPYDLLSGNVAPVDDFHLLQVRDAGTVG